MGYIIALVLIVIIVPLIFLLLSRRTSGGGGIDSSDHGVSRMEPSEEDTPTTDQTHNTTPSARKLPPA